MTLTSNCGKSYVIKKKISIPAETKNESFLTSCSMSKNDVLTYIFNDLTSKVRPRHHSVAPISPGRGKNLPRWAPPPPLGGVSQHSNQLLVPRHTECGGWWVRALSLFLYWLIIQRTVAGEFPKPQRSITRAIQSAGERGKIFPYPGEISPRRPPVKSS